MTTPSAAAHTAPPYGEEMSTPAWNTTVPLNGSSRSPNLPVISPSTGHRVGVNASPTKCDPGSGTKYDPLMATAAPVAFFAGKWSSMSALLDDASGQAETAVTSKGLLRKPTKPQFTASSIAHNCNEERHPFRSLPVFWEAWSRYSTVYSSWRSAE